MEHTLQTCCTSFVGIMYRIPHDNQKWQVYQNMQNMYTEILTALRPSSHRPHSAAYYLHTSCMLPMVNGDPVLLKVDITIDVTALRLESANADSGMVTVEAVAGTVTFW